MENRRIYPCASDEYAIEVTEKRCNRRDEIVDMLTKNFLRDETLVKSLRINAGMTKSEENDYFLDERLMMETVVDAGTVLVSIHKKTNRISGAVIINIHDRESNQGIDKSKKSEPFEGRLRSKVTRDFYKHMENIQSVMAGELFARYPNCRFYAEFELIGVNEPDRRKGIALDLYKASLSLIKDIPGIKMVCGTYTSIYSIKVAEKIGKSIVSKFDVTKLRDDRGNPVFQDTVPNNFVALMAMEI